MALVPPSSKFGNAPLTLGAKATGWTLSNPGDTNEHLLTSFAIPANTIGVGATVEIVVMGSFTNSANNKSLRMRLGAANDLTGTTLENVAYTTNSAYRTFFSFVNRATNQQVFQVTGGTGGFGASTTAGSPTAVDTTVGLFFVFSVQLALGTEAFTLDTYRVSLIPAV